MELNGYYKTKVNSKAFAISILTAYTIMKQVWGQAHLKVLE